MGEEDGWTVGWDADRTSLVAFAGVDGHAKLARLLRALERFDVPRTRRLHDLAWAHRARFVDEGGRPLGDVVPSVIAEVEAALVPPTDDPAEWSRDWVEVDPRERVWLAVVAVEQNQARAAQVLATARAAGHEGRWPFPARARW